MAARLWLLQVADPTVDGRGKLSLLFLSSGETATSAPYRFLAAADLSAMACFFFWLALFATACFCEFFFWLDFGDLSPMILLLFFQG